MSDARGVLQLSDGDAVFLSMETETAWGHIGGLIVLDPTAVPDFGADRVVRTLEQRIALVPRFGWKLKETPLGLDRPYWVPCPDFDVRRHVQRVAAPSPGGAAELGELVGALFARPLDRSRPLWRVWVIEGLAGGRRAVLLESHHCLMDGESGAGLTEVLLDLAPDAERPLRAQAFDERPPRPPNAAEIAARAVRHAVDRPLRRVRHVRRALQTAAASLRPWRSDEFAPPAWSDVPAAPFNRAIGARRRLAFASLDFERVKDLKKHFDVTVNDAVLAVIAGALRRWLRAKRALPERQLVAICPVSLRGADDRPMGNRISMMPVGLATDRADPGDRLRCIARQAREAKEALRTGSFDVLAALGESFAPGVVNLLVRAIARAPERIPMPGNLVVSNVRCTPVPLYMAGARVEALYPISVLQPGQGLNATAVSYAGRLDFGFTADPELVPDADALAAQIPRAFAELEAAAEGVRYRAR